MEERETDSDAEVLQRAIQGEAEAIEFLLTANSPRLTAYVTKRFPAELNSTISPVDVVQDTCFEICRRLGTFKDEGKDSFYRWIVTIARHRMIDLLRMHRARPQFSVQKKSQPNVRVSEDDSAVGALEQLAQYRRTPSQSAASHEFMAAVELSLDRIQPDYRQAVTLRHLEGLSVSETASRLGRSPDAVYLLCCRGLQALRQELGSRSHFI